MSERGRDTDELLAAFVDGVGELTTDERRRVEARLAEADGFRADAAATRELIGTLRELPDEGSEPDWAAMERAIRAEVGPSVPRPWWRGWRWLVPVGALALSAAVLVLVLRTPEPAQVAPVALQLPNVSDAGADGQVQTSPDEVETVSLWLDGEEIDVELQAAELLGPEDLGPGSADDDDAVGLLPAGDLAWVDDLGDDDIAAAEAWLAKRKS
ncbi:MAG: hypothetical protein IPQ07_32065 [Myxococcales bacterium]|nr:hypothetical protein [Myxococcales bacterium]